MRSARSAALALRVLRRQRVRTALMMFAVTLGIASLTALDSIGERTRRETLERFRSMLGTFDTIIVRPGAGRMRGMVSLVNVPPTLKFEDAEALSSLSCVRRVARVQNAFDIDASHRGQTGSPAVFGVSSNWLALRGDELDQGSFFTEDDERALARVAVLGPDAARDLFPAESPLGKSVRLGSVAFQVSGVLRSRGMGPGGSSLDNVVLVPVTTASRRLFNRDYLTMAIVQLRDPERSDAALEEVTALLRERHHIAKGALDDFTATSPRAVMARVTRLGSTLSTIVRGVGLLALFIGGLVITTLMGSSVFERRREIGVARAVGASRADILQQFLLEATLVAGLGGMIGIALGVGSASLVARLLGAAPLVAWRTVAWAAAVSIGLGIAFGAYPAWRAARVDPADALRA